MITYPLSDSIKKEVIKSLSSNQDRLSIPEVVRKSALLYTIKDSPALTKEILSKGWTNGNFKAYSPDGSEETSPLKIAAENYRDNPKLENVLTLQVLLNFKVKHEDMQEIENIVASAVSQDSEMEVIKDVTLNMIKYQNVDLNSNLENNQIHTQNKVYDPSFIENINPNEFIEKKKDEKNIEEKNIEEKKNKPKEESLNMEREEIEYSSGKSLPVDYFRRKLKFLVEERRTFHKVKALEEPKWILQQNEKAKEFWARLQLSTIGADLGSEATMGGVTTLLAAYGILGVAPMFTPQVYKFLNNALGWTNMLDPSWVDAAPVVGLAVILLAIPSKIMGFLKNINDNAKQKEMDKIIIEAIEENLIDPQKFMEELKQKGGFKKSFLEKLINQESQIHKIDRYIYNSIKNYNKKSLRKVDTDIGINDKTTSKEFLDQVKSKIMKESQNLKSKEESNHKKFGK